MVTVTGACIRHGTGIGDTLVMAMVIIILGIMKDLDIMDTVAGMILGIITTTTDIIMGTLVVLVMVIIMTISTTRTTDMGTDQAALLVVVAER